MSQLLLENLRMRVLTHVTFVAKEPGDILDSDALRALVVKAEAMDPWRTMRAQGGGFPPSLATYSFPASRARDRCKTRPGEVVETCMLTLEAGEALPAIKLSAYVKSMGSLVERVRVSLPPVVDSAIGISFTFITQYSEIPVD
jgi:hypothetical protein